MLKSYCASTISVRSKEKREVSESVPLTEGSGSGSWRVKNIRIPNTGEKYSEDVGQTKLCAEEKSPCGPANMVKLA